MDFRVVFAVVFPGAWACAGSEHAHEVAAPVDAAQVDINGGGASVVETKGGKYKISFATDPSPIPLSRLFAVDSVVTDSAGVPVTEGSLGIDATMPHHGHGMSTRPENMVGSCLPSGKCRHEGGKYRTEGMKFHMPGEWTVEFVVDGPAGTDSARVVLAI